MRDFWVFGYGSLIWNPGFDFLERMPATLHGLHRSLCIYSWVHRGTQDNPGLVLGLDKGGSCRGVAMKVAEQNRDHVIQYLRDRELVTNVYLETWRNAKLIDGRKVPVLVYRVDQTHPQYTNGLDLDHQVEIVRVSQGKSGSNDDYVKSTVAALHKENIRDHNLEYVARKLD